MEYNSRFTCNLNAIGSEHNYFQLIESVGKYFNLLEDNLALIFENSSALLV